MTKTQIEKALKGLGLRLEKWAPSYGYRWTVRPDTLGEYYARNNFELANLKEVEDFLDMAQIRRREA